MADIWASFSEVGKLCACSTDEARSLIRMRGWPRRTCSDGITRAKLPDDLTQAFIRLMVLELDLDRIADANVARLTSLVPKPQAEAQSAQKRIA